MTFLLTVLHLTLIEVKGFGKRQHSYDFCWTQPWGNLSKSRVVTPHLLGNPTWQRTLSLHPVSPSARFFGWGVQRDFTHSPLGQGS